ncbi:hypothetical protein CYLTODRAFT_420049 [Cylindrobasidium torrendii FP15055 ss-10]|uniref:Uncharacterized protein n=1 Tax=Cylindrobasidium torrendii FP15055 ss-10 TaxID=1314674 RepID=A0A0D7BI33_9AGAR|nr:hypothetical protein CYLTODRAFT_420049 [Cylindrobasidium torrendii FP15055 ss-10]
MDSAAIVVRKLPEFLRHANYVQNVEDIDAVRAEERQLNEEISKLDEEIQAYQDTLAFHRQKLEHYTKLLQDAQNRKDDASSALARDQQLLLPSSLRTVPNEVLSNIFIQYIAMCHFFENYGRHFSYRSRGLWVQTGRIYIPHTVLRLVCRRWNSVAVSEPHLWQTVPFIMPPAASDADIEVNKGLDHEYWRQVTRNIARARTLPLDLQVRIARKKGPLSPSLLHDFLCRLKDLLPRTTHLNFEIDYISFDSAEVLASTLPLPSPSDEFPTTSFVVGSECSLYGKGLDRWILSLMAYMPMLNFARLPSMYGSHDTPEVLTLDTRYNWLTTVQLDNASVTALAGLFKCAYSLISLSIAGVDSAPPGSPILRHDTLSELSITEHDSADCLSRFALPALKKLRIGNRDRAEWHSHSMRWPCNSISEFDMQSRCALTELAVYCPLSEPEKIIPFLSSQPSLTSLTLKSAPRSLFSLLCVPTFVELRNLHTTVPITQDAHWKWDRDTSVLELMETLRKRHDIVKRGDACQCVSWMIVFHLEGWQLFGAERRRRADMRKLEADFEAIGSRLALSTEECRAFF